MKLRPVFLLLVIGLLSALSGSAALTRVRWDALPALQLPDLDNSPFTTIELEITGVPDGAIGQVNTMGPCHRQVRWDCSVAVSGRMDLIIENRFGYGEEFARCEERVSVEFWVRDGLQLRHHCDLAFSLTGDRQPPICSIGKVGQHRAAHGDDSLVYLFPILEYNFAPGATPIRFRPHFQVYVEGEGIDRFQLDGWDDCSGRGSGINRRSTCPDRSPIPLKTLVACKGIVTITFAPRIDQSEAAFRDVEIRYDSDDLSFRYDVLADTLVER